MDEEGSAVHVVDPQEAGPRDGPYEEHPVGNVSYLTQGSPEFKRRCCITRVKLTHAARYRACWLDALTGVHHTLGLPMMIKVDLTHARCINEFAYCRKLSEKLGVSQEDPPEDLSPDHVCSSHPVLRVGPEGKPRSDARTIDVTSRYRSRDVGPKGKIGIIFRSPVGGTTQKWLRCAPTMPVGCMLGSPSFGRTEKFRIISARSRLRCSHTWFSI